MDHSSSTHDPGTGLEMQLRDGRPDFGDQLGGLRERILARAVRKVPSIVGRYEVGRTLGSGSFGTVYEARDPQLGRAVALKIVTVRSERDAERVVREARMLATLSDPHVVHVFEVGLTDGAVAAPYVVMELVRGQTLRDWMQQRTRPWRDVVDMMLQAARGLAAAHRAGIVHRDFKPDNALIGEDGRLRVVDFGLARLFDETAVTDANEPDVFGSQTLTPLGRVMGTPAYMAPEAFSGHMDPASDQYSLCVALYEGLFGRRPFAASSSEELRAKVRRHRPELPRDRGGVPARVCAVVMKGLGKAPEDRYPDLDAFIVALQTAGRPRRAPWPALAVAAGFTVAAGAWWMPASPTCESGDARWQRAVGSPALPEDVAAAIDEQRRAWIDTEESLCRATAATTLPWVQRSCLDRRLRDVAALAEHLAAQDPTDTTKAADAVRALPDIGGCAEPNPDATAAPDPDHANEVEALERRLSQLRALDATSSLDHRALASSTQLLLEARALGYRPLLAEVSRMHARTLQLNGQYDNAHTAFESTYFLAQEEALPRLAAHTATELFRLDSYYRHDLDAARTWLAHADAAFARLGVDPRTHMPYLDGRAGMAEAEADHASAAVFLREAIERLEARGSGRSQVRGDVSNHLGAVLYAQGEYEAALEAMQISASIYEEIEGPRSARRAAALDNMGMCLGELKRLDEALALHLEALQIREDIGPEQPDLGASYGNLGLLLLQLDRLDEAMTYTNRALAFFEAYSPPGAPSIAMTYQYRAATHAAYGPDGTSAARRDYTRARRMFEDLGPRYAETVQQIDDALAALDAHE
jgi:tetratricopeptide (TPR) repeat protein/predicted Ser/Thr protein kinase